MKKKSRALALVLAMLLAFGVLSACGGDSGEGKNEPAETKFAFKSTYSPVDLGEDSYVGNAVYSNGKIYFTAQIADGVVEREYQGIDENGNPVTETYEETNYVMALYSINSDATEMTRLEGFKSTPIPEGMQGNSYIQSLQADANGALWVLEEVSSYYYTGEGGSGSASTTSVSITAPMAQPESNGFVDNGTTYILRKLDETGATAVEIDLKDVFNAAEGEYIYIAGMTIDGSGNVFITDGNKNIIYVLGSDGSTLFTMELPGWIRGMSSLGDGTPVIVTMDENEGKYVVKTIDVAKKGFGETYESPANIYDLYPGDDTYDFYYKNSTKLVGYDMETGTSTDVLDWLGCDVDADRVSSVSVLENGDVVAVYDDYESDVRTKILNLTKVDASTLPQKTTLTYACMYLNYEIRGQILKFNRSSDTYRIEVIDYSQYNTEEDYTAGLTKLTTEIISGKVPDLLDVNQLPIRQYAAKGLLEDLMPFMEKDTEIGGREALVPAALNTLMTDGKLYQVSPSFSVSTMVTLKDVTGDITSWNVEEVLAALATLPDGASLMGIGYDKLSLLSTVLYQNLDKFVDWETGECNFDSQEFIDILKLTELMPAEFNWDDYDWEANPRGTTGESLAEGSQLMGSFQLYGVYDYMWELGVDLKKYSFPGIPTADGTTGSSMSFESGIAMSSKCVDKEGAWQFLRTFLTESYQNENVWNLPTNQKVLDSKFKEAMTPEYETDENGNRVEIPKRNMYIGNSDEPIKVYAMDTETHDLIMSIINGATTSTSYDENLMAIVNEECAAYFAGQSTAENTAGMIQSRVTIYVNEQR